MSVTAESIIKDMRAGRYAPVYLLQGEETFFIDQVGAFVERNALPEEQRGFNQTVFYGKDSDLKKVVSAARRFPMMAERQVVVVKEAQDLLDWKQEASQKLLLSYLENPVPTTILVFCHKRKNLAKNTKLYKAFDKVGVVLSTKKMYDSQLPQWIKNMVKSKGGVIDDMAAQMLADYIGTDLERLSNEVDKIFLNFKEKGVRLDEEMIRKFVGISKEYNPFELQKAIAFRDVMKANRIVNFFEANPKDHPIIPLISLLYNYFAKLLLLHHASDKSDGHLSRTLGVPPFILKEYRMAARNYDLRKVVACIRYLKEADLASKGVDAPSITQGQILRELVFKVLH
ncbi:DNA polymerase III subunit delta [Fulvitalea axinellae]|uniref:DNA polymerase III subunit delta n=1 Tax=Fulvitalea axinellae TaxID=1182444 RepID=A0AAU9CCB2_9BACT|nr:DNA polymerase III subunit delta [Fulvitalea axinellae]